MSDKPAPTYVLVPLPVINQVLEFLQRHPLPWVSTNPLIQALTKCRTFEAPSTQGPESEEE